MLSSMKVIIRIDFIRRWILFESFKGCYQSYDFLWFLDVKGI
jgi:hypothetical protein